MANKKMEELLSEIGDVAIAPYIKELTELEKSLTNKLKELRQEHQLVNPVFEIKLGDKLTKLKANVHKDFKTILTLAAQRHNVLLVGMAGTGKTMTAEQVAEALELPFYAISVCSQTSKSDLVGYMNATGKNIDFDVRIIHP
jgi:MoxR-like ATPase